MDIFQALAQAQSASQLAQNEMGRQKKYAAIVTENSDPQNMRRVKVSDPANPGKNTPWIMRELNERNFDPPLPQIGDTVTITSIDDDITKGFYSVAVNASNPPHNKSDVVLDSSRKVEGNQQERTDKDRVIDVGKSLTLRTDSGASIQLTASGSIVITSSSGSSFTLDGGIVTSTGSFTVGGKEIATVGAADNDDGDTLVTRGW